MRVTFVSLFVNGLFDPTDSTVYGGAEVQLYYLATGFAAQGIDTHVVTRSQRDSHLYTAEGVTVHAIAPRSGLLSKPLTAWDLYTEVWRTQADVYVQRCAGIETYLVARAAKRQGKQFIFMSASTQDCTDKLIRRGQRFVYRMYERGLWLADKIIVQNETQQRLFFERWKRNSVVLPSACAIPESDESERGGSILWMGRCETYKGPDQFLDLAESLPNYCFVMVMPAGVNQDFDRQIRARAQSLPNVELHGAVPLRETERFFRRAALHVNTSEFEGFPNTFLQAAAAGVPLLSLNVDPGRILAREGLGYCAESNPKQLREYIERLMDDSNTRHEIGTRGKAYIRAHHDRQQIVNQFRAMLEKFDS